MSGKENSRSGWQCALSVVALLAVLAGSFALPQDRSAAKARGVAGAKKIQPIDVQPIGRTGELARIVLKNWPDGTHYMEGTFGQYWYTLPDGRRARLQARQRRDP